MRVELEVPQIFNIKNVRGRMDRSWSYVVGCGTADGKNDTRHSWAGCMDGVSVLTDSRGTGGGSGL